MHRLLLLLPILFGIAAILRAEQPEWHVLARKPLVVLVRRFNLPAICGTGAPNVEACTAFVGQRLSCQCEQRNDGWRMTLSAQFIPVMYVLGSAYVTHERDHIKDIEESVRKYVAEQESIEFESAEACEAEATIQVANFAHTMNRFKEDSQAARHRGYKRKMAD